MRFVRVAASSREKTCSGKSRSGCTVRHSPHGICRFSMAITPRAISYWSRAIETPEPRRVRGRMSFAFAGACAYVGTLVLPGAGNGALVLIACAAILAFVVPNDVAFFAAVLPLSLALIVDSPKSTRAWLAAVSSVTALAVVVVYQSRSALLTSLVAVTLWACRLQRRKGAALLGVAMFVTVATDALLGFPLVTRLAETWSTRVPIWLAALNMFRDAPLLGNGPRSFGLLFEEYFQTLTLPGWLPADPRFAPWAHSLYLETLAEQGIIGFGALVAVLSVGFAMTIGLRRAGPSETRVLAIGAETALVALCVAGVVELSFVRLWVVVLFFSVLGAIGALAATRREAGETCGVQ